MEFFIDRGNDIKLIKQCIELGNLCNSEDKLCNPIFQLEDSPVVFYTLIDSELIGYIGASLVNPNVVELSGFVLPKYRNQKIASRLLEMIFDEYENYEIQVSIDSNNHMGKWFLESYDAKYLCRECLFELEKNNYKSVPATIQLSVDTDKPTKYIAIMNNQEIGTVSIFSQGDTFTIHDVEIYKDYRGKKLSYELLYAILNEQFINSNKAILHVTKENTAAYKLYSNLGFRPTQQLDYYSL